MYFKGYGKACHPRIDLNLNIRGLSPSAALAINEKCKALRAEGREVFHLGFGQSPVPEPVVECLRQSAWRKNYLAVKGLHELRQAIAGYWKRRQGLDYSPEIDEYLHQALRILRALGKHFYQELQNMGIKSLNGAFVKECAPQMIEAFRRMKDWVK